jgi:hypothetical protein
MSITLKNRMPRILMIGTHNDIPIKAIFTGGSICLKLYNDNADSWMIIGRDIPIAEYSKWFDTAYIRDTDFEFAMLLKAAKVDIRMVYGTVLC